MPDLDLGARSPAIDDAIAGERKVATRIALSASLPDWLAARLVADWGDEAETLALALNTRAPMTVRANLLNVVPDRAALAAELGRAKLVTSAGTWCDTALHIESRTNLFALDAFRRGALEVQDEGSQLLADLVPAAMPTRAECAAEIAAASPSSICARARAARRSRSRRGSAIAGRHRSRPTSTRASSTSCADARAAAKSRSRKPCRSRARIGLPRSTRCAARPTSCSSMRRARESARWRRNPEARWRMRDGDFAELATRQRQILDGAWELCAPGGRIVYATCTLLPVENADVVAAALAAHEDLAVVPLRELVGEERAMAIGDGDALTVTPRRRMGRMASMRRFMRAST